MKFSKSGLLIAALTVLVLVGGLYYFIKDEPFATRPVRETETTKLSPTFTGGSLVEERDGRKIWELYADTIEADPGSQMIHLKNLKGVFYRDNGGRIDIAAPEGSLDNTTKNISLTGGVKAVTDDGTALSADGANWDNQRQVLAAIGHVILTREDTVLTGDQLESDVNMEKVKLQGNARIRKGG